MPTKKRGRPKKVRPEVQPEQKTEYFLQLHVGGRIYFGDGNSMLEALWNLEEPQKIVTKGTLKIQAGEKKKDINMVIPQMKRLFYPLAKLTVAKQLELLCK